MDKAWQDYGLMEKLRWGLIEEQTTSNVVGQQADAEQSAGGESSTASEIAHFD